MHKCLLALLFILTVAPVFAQEPEKLFEKAWTFYQEKKYDSSLQFYETIYKKSAGDETLIAKSFFNMGDIYMVKKDYKKAKEIFLAILDSDYDEMDRGGKGEGLMGEPYALYKNNSCKNLAEMALEEKKFKDALYYTKLFDYEYPYHHFCGNEYKSNDIYVAWTYARCYEGLNKTGEALAALLPQCMYSGLASNDYLVEMTCKLIKDSYSKEEIQAELQKAALNIYSKSKGSGKNKYEIYYTDLFGTPVQLYQYSESRSGREEFLSTENLKDIERYKYYFINSNFYKTLVK